VKASWETTVSTNVSNCAVAAPKPFPSDFGIDDAMLKNGPTSPVIGSIPGQPVGSSSNQVFAFSSP